MGTTLGVRLEDLPCSTLERLFRKTMNPEVAWTMGKKGCPAVRALPNYDVLLKPLGAR